jgi:hypothetical protein
VRLGALLASHQADVGGTWEERRQAHDAALAEVSLPPPLRCCASSS